MSMEQQIMEALARGYCVEPNTSKVLDSDLIMAMTQEVLKSVGFIPKDDSHLVKKQVSQKNAPERKVQLYFISYSFWQYTYDDSKPGGDTVEGFENTVEDCHIERFEDVEALEDKLRKRLEYDGLTIINYIKIN